MSLFASRTRLTEEQQIALAVRILDNRHLSDVYDRATRKLGGRARTLGPLDLSRNSLRSGVARLNQAHEIPPAVDGLAPEMAALLGDVSARTTVKRYARIGAHPMPSPMVTVARDAARYWLGAGYSARLLGWSERARVLYTDTVSPDALRLHYASDDPTEPTVIEHFRLRRIGDRVVEVTDTYDLTDLDRPAFTSRTGTQGRGKDVTAQVLGEEAAGAGWPDLWRDEDGRPFHRLVVLGSNRYPYATLGAIEATLNVSTHWTAWGAGINDAGHPQRNVEGLELVGADSNAETGETGIAAGPETVLVWRRVDADAPGNHWQDGPGYDPEAIGRAIRSYEVAAMNALGLPINYESTGGEPTEQERLAIEAAIAQTYDSHRRADGEVLRRAAAMLNRLALDDVPTLAERRYPVLYRTEITEALAELDEAEAAEREAAASGAAADDESDDTAGQ